MSSLSEQFMKQHQCAAEIRHSFSERRSPDQSTKSFPVIFHHNLLVDLRPRVTTRSQKVVQHHSRLRMLGVPRVLSWTPMKQNHPKVGERSVTFSCTDGKALVSVVLVVDALTFPLPLEPHAARSNQAVGRFLVHHSDSEDRVRAWETRHPCRMVVNIESRWQTCVG